MVVLTLETIPNLRSPIIMSSCVKLRAMDYGDTLTWTFLPIFGFGVWDTRNRSQFNGYRRPSILTPAAVDCR